MKTHARALTVALVLLLTLSLPVSRPAGAATLTVSDCGDSGGPKQLRNTVATAGVGDTINIGACTITLTLAAGGELPINKDLRIVGAGAGKTILDGGGVTRVFHVTAGTVIITDVTIRNGHPTFGSGGGILLDGTGFLGILHSTVSGNTAPAFGGGLANESSTAFLGVSDSTVSGNSAQGDGGGGIDNSAGTLVVVTSTVSSNSTSAPFLDAAGGIATFGSSAMTVVLGSTINGNTGPNVGLRATNSGSVTLKNTIVSHNTPANCGVGSGGVIVSSGHNLDSGNTCFPSTISEALLADLINTDPMLGPLQLNGGPTPTHALLPGSPAIDAGDNAICLDPPTDQRGVPRSLDATNPGFTVCDIGAFEVETLGFIQASLALNTATVRPGTLVQGTVMVANDGGVRPLDVYVALVAPASAGPGFGCPGGDALVFLTGAGAVLTCVSSGVQTFAPFVSNVALSADLFTPVSGSVFSFGWPSGAPTGPWGVALVMTPVGAFSDGRVNPTAGIVLATAGFIAQ